MVGSIHTFNRQVGTNPEAAMANRMDGLPGTASAMAMPGASATQTNTTGHCTCPCCQSNAPAANTPPVSSADTTGTGSAGDMLQQVLGMILEIIKTMIQLLGGSTGGASSVPPANTSAPKDAEKATADSMDGQRLSTLSADNGVARSAKGLRPNQMTAGFSVPNAACGLAAAMTFALSKGKNLDAKEVERVAREKGIPVSTLGQSQVADLADALGAPATNVEGKIDWNRVKKEVSAGKPVIIHLDGHYWVAEAYDAATGEFEWGTSLSQFKNFKGDSKLTPEQLKAAIPGLGAGLGTGERGAVYMD